MTRPQLYTDHQKGIIRRYYERKGDIVFGRLEELVSILYLCENEAKAAKLWENARALLLQAGANRIRIAKVLTDRNVEGLARLVGELA